MSRPGVLSEAHLPVEAIGAESQRERGASSALPPLYFLHVWWARRPLVVSAAAVLGGLLPDFQGLQDLGSPELRQKFPTPEAYHAWFLRLLGIHGDPAAGRKLIQWAKQRDVRLKENPYGGAPRAFTVNPAQEDLQTLLDILQQTWGTREIVVMDPMAGGGSIPFEALRYGFTVLANELNPVASVVLKATLDYPARFGPQLADDIRKWGQRANDVASQRLREFFPMQHGERIRRYLWARTVACPSTGKPVPLSPNWWLSNDPPIAVRVLTDPAWDEPRFEIVHLTPSPSPRRRGETGERYDPDEGTVKRGVGRSPWTGEPVDGEYIKREAQAGRMGQTLYALSIQTGQGYDFRAPTDEDSTAVRRAEAALAENMPAWEAAGLVPREPFPGGNDLRPILYGMPTWADFFAPRQLLSLVTLLEALREVGAEMRCEMDEMRAAAVETYLGFCIDKCCDRNCYASRWIPQRAVMGSRSERHDFSFKWSYAEMTLPDDGFVWAVDQIADAYSGLAELLRSVQSRLWDSAGDSPVDRLHVWQGSAADLQRVATGSVHHICVDPPYYDNVMYAELSDFFYVWLKRSVGHLYPDFFRDHLTNKDDEAVANPARFKDLTPDPSPTRRGGSSRDLAKQDYERKMAACFREMGRTLRDDGVLTVMFTHKQVEAWDTLAMALIGAGFSIQASWPVPTEFEHSLHQAKKNAAQSTILLVCRKRTPVGQTLQSAQGRPESQHHTVWWDDLKGRVREVAREKAAEFAEQGITGVDLYISTFGPVLSVISEHWPVLTSELDEKTGQPKPLRPDVALDLAREEVMALRKRGLLLGREVQFDPVTDWYLMVWDAFKAEEFPADEARKWAMMLGLDVESDLVRGKRVITKKGSTVVLQSPTARRHKGMADPDAATFDTLLDAVHTAMLIYEEDGARDCEVFLKRTGLRADAAFRACLQAMLNAVPRTKLKGKFVRPETETLENLRLAFFDDLTAPVEETLEIAGPQQMGLWGGGEEGED